MKVFVFFLCSLLCCIKALRVSTHKNQNQYNLNGMVQMQVSIILRYDMDRNNFISFDELIDYI